MVRHRSLSIFRALLWLTGAGAPLGLMLALARAQSPLETGQPIRTKITIGVLGGPAWGANGRPWRRLGTEAKVTFLNGIQEGILLMIQQAAQGSDEVLAGKFAETSKSITIAGVRFLDLVGQIDEFYGRQDNTSIPVIEAYRYAVAKLKGASGKDLEQRVLGLRQTYEKESREGKSAKP